MTSLGARGRTDDKTRSTGNNSGSSSNHCTSVWEKHHLLWEHCRGVWIALLLLIVQWFLKLIYSVCILIYVPMYQCINIATHLHTVYLDWLQAVLERNSRCAWKWWSSELRDTLWGRERDTSEMHLEAVIERIWRYSWRPWLSELRSALQGHDWGSLEMHLEAMIVWTWRPKSSECGDRLGGCDWGSLATILEAMIDWVRRCTLRPWSREIGRVLGGGRWMVHRVLRLH